MRGKNMSNTKAGVVPAPLLSDSPTPRKKSGAGNEDYESRVTRKAIWWTVVPVLVFTLALTVMLSMENDKSTAPAPPVGDLSVALVGVHRAATAAGIAQFHSADLHDIGAWLASQQVVVARVPDLSAAGLRPYGARLLSMSDGQWGMVHYKADGLQAPDVVLVISPAGAASVPPEAVEEAFTGQAVKLDRVRGVGLAYATLLGNDWTLVSAVDETALRGLVTKLLSALH